MHGGAVRVASHINQQGCSVSRFDHWLGYYCLAFFVKKSSVCQESKSTVPFWINIVLTRYLFLQSTQSQTLESWRAFGADTVPFKGPQAHLVCCFWSIRDIRTLSGLWHKGRMSQDAVKSHRHKPWLCICRKHTLFIYTFESWLLKANRIEMIWWPDLFFWDSSEHRPDVQRHLACGPQTPTGQSPPGLSTGLQQLHVPGAQGMAT